MDATAEERTSETRAGARAGLGLSGRLLLLTVLFVMLAEVLIYVPSVANFRRNWLRERLAAAQTAAMALVAAPAGAVPPELERRLVAEVGAATIHLRAGSASRLLAAADARPAPSRDIDLRNAGPLDLLAGAFDTLLARGDRHVRVVGEGMGGVETVEMVLAEAPLRRAMLGFSLNILLLSLAISGITAGLVYLALHRLIVRPVRRLTSSIMRFGEDPEDLRRVIVPSSRTDEIGLAERALARMQTRLAEELRNKRRLAALGLAVAKINHDLRGMLATAQLFSDRLQASADPIVQRLAPKLVAALDRAIGFCERTLSHGRAAEPPPRRRRFPLASLVQDLPDLVGIPEGVAFVADVPEGLDVDADPDQLARVLANLVRNAVQALEARDAGAAPGLIRIRARRDSASVAIEVADNGPGVPRAARARLFEAFRGAARAGGVGLGLAIADELVRAHGGTIALAEAEAGAVFRVTIPDGGAPPDAPP